MLFLGTQDKSYIEWLQSNNLRSDSHSTQHTHCSVRRVVGVLADKDKKDLR